VDTADLEAYLGEMEKATTWGDHTTLQACADCYNVRIHLITTHSSNSHLIVEPAGGVHGSNNIRIGFHSEMHYLSDAVAKVKR